MVEISLIIMRLHVLFSWAFLKFQTSNVPYKITRQINEENLKSLHFTRELDFHRINLIYL